jgi:selenocysteine lyase/cysteine desulfurase
LACASGAAPFTARIDPLAQAARRPSAADFLFDPGLAYLNTGALGPTPRPVLDRVLSASQVLESNPSDQGYGPLAQQMDAVRSSAASFFHCQPDEIVLTDSTTNGMNAVALGVDLNAGDRVLTSNQEHMGGRMCWNHLARKHGVVIDEVALPPLLFDAEQIVTRFMAKLTPRTRVLSVSHVTSSTGHVLPIARLAAALHGMNCLLVVDGAQSAGAIPVDLGALGCHAYAMSGHKWLMGPKGTGLLFISRSAASRIEPAFLENGRSAYTDATGVRDIPAILGLGAALQYFMSWDKSTVERRVITLRNLVYERLKTLTMLKVVSPPPGEAAAPMVTFLLPDRVANEALQTKLRVKHRIAVKTFPRKQLNGLRISTHVFNTEDEVARLIAALRHELA